MGKQHKGMNEFGVSRFPRGSGREGQVKNSDIISRGLTILKIKGLA